MTTTQSNVEAVLGLTPAQAGIVYHVALAAEPGTYIQQYVCTLEGGVDVDMLRSAWEAVIARHQALRSVILWEGRERPLQVVRGGVEVEFRYEDLAHLGAATRQFHIESHLQTDRARGFDLERGPLARVSVFGLGPGRLRMIWTHHHVIVDGWSIGLVLDDLLEAYDALADGRAWEPEPAHGLAELSAHREHRSAIDAEAAWSSHLEGARSSAIADAAGSDAEGWAERQEEVALELSSGDHQAIVETARAAEVTLGQLVSAAWALVVERHTGSTDVLFGTTVAGRPAAVVGSMSTVGMFLNTIPVRIRVQRDQEVGAWLREIQRSRIEMQPHDWASLADIQAWVGAPKGRPFFESLVVFENVPGSGRGGRLRVSDEEYRQRSDYPLALLVFPGDRMELRLLYDPSRFTREMSKRLLGQMERALTEIAASPDRLVGSIDVLPHSEKSQILELSRGEVVPPVGGTVLSWIEEQSAERPGAAAVVGGGVTLTYSELMERSTDLARALAARGAGPGSPVLVGIPRSPAGVVAALGTMLAGAAYVPYDAGVPATRADELAGMTGAVVSLAGNGSTHPVPEGTVRFEIGPEGECDQPASGELGRPGGGDTAYVMFTSGSTGSPKGVEVTHAALAHSTGVRRHVYWDPPRSFLMMSPLYFDSSLAGLYWTLSAGGTLVLPEEGEERDVPRLVELAAANSVSHLLALPSVYRLLLDAGHPRLQQHLEVAIVAGERCDPTVVGAHFDRLPMTRLYNEYGPTEAVVWCAVQEMKRRDQRDPSGVPIGSPIPNTSLYLLDDELRLVPRESTGEICVAGPGLARGYLGDPQLTDRSFVDVDLGLGATRVYRTGDLARYDTSGLLHLTGRKDHQMKLSGRRMEPGEIEQVMLEHPSVEDAVVTQAGDSPQIIGFYVSPDPDIEPGLRSHLEERLPRYMVPGVLEALPSLPVGPNGKLDRSALPASELPPRQSPVVEGEGEEEALVLRLARLVLGRDDVSITDNFFDAGGHSLMSMQLIARLNEESGTRVPPNALLFGSLRQVASHLAPGPAPAPAWQEETAAIDEAMWLPSGAFGVLTLPIAPSGPGVVICPPYGWEYYKTHRALRRLGVMLSDAGHPVFRLDYTGTGDALGDVDDVGMERWIDDITTAVSELARRTGIEEAAIVGLRLGANLAAQAARRSGRAHRLVLWDPIAAGAEHLETLSDMHRRQFQRSNPRAASALSGNSLLGSPYPHWLRAALGEMVFDPSALPTAATVIASSDEYASRLRSPETVVEVVEDQGNWDDLAAFNSALLPDRIPRRIRALLGDDA